MLDVARLKSSWGVVAEYGDEVPQYFYSTLFVVHPQTRAMFPPSMAAQRDRLVGALGYTVANVDNLDQVVPVLQQLGRDHRKFGVEAEHYPLVGEALIMTLEHFLGEQWDRDLEQAWGSAYEVIAKVMSDAAAEAASHTPPWWNAEVIAREQRTFDITVLTLRTDYHFPYQPGQSVTVEAPLRPAQWRHYSLANAPRPDGTLELHVRAVPGGAVSPTLAHLTQVGDSLRVGAAVGSELTLTGDGDLLLLAGGTGLAPMRALAEEVASAGGHRRVHLFVGARSSREMYDLKALRDLEQRYPPLTVTPVLSDDPLRSDGQSTAIDAALRAGRYTDHEVYVCGSTEMVRGSLARLDRAGVDRRRVHVDELHSALHPPLVPEYQEQR
jgi:NAD(P)H-flavin reductase/hemoglobin-like flavoprotein